MQVRFLSSVSVITSDPAADRRLFVDALGLPLAGGGEGDYVFSESVDGSRHFGVWPLREAAEACFGQSTWPADRPVPQASVEFDVHDVPGAVAELEARGYRMIHGARTEPWGQTIARLQSADGLIVGVGFTPWMREDAAD
jgi:hypothetical protein